MKFAILLEAVTLFIAHVYATTFIMFKRIRNV